MRLISSEKTIKIDYESAPDRLNARHPIKKGEIVLTLIILLMILKICISLSTNENLQWEVFAKYVTQEMILKGIWVTITLTVLSSIIGLAVGIVLAAMSNSSYIILKLIARGFIWFSRGVPVLVHLLIWFNLALFVPTISIGIPFIYTFWEIPTNTLITSFTASILALSLAEAAYMAEIVRGGLNSVDSGQSEAAKALGMTRGQTMRLILLPQSMRSIIPPISNQIILMLKTTSLVSVIAGNDLLTRVKDIYNDNFQIVPLLLVATFWYLFFTTIATMLQNRLENYYSKGFSRRKTIVPQGEVNG